MQKMQSEEDAKWLHREEENLVFVAVKYYFFESFVTLLLHIRIYFS